MLFHTNQNAQRTLIVVVSNSPGIEKSVYPIYEDYHELAYTKSLYMWHNFYRDYTQKSIEIPRNP